MNGESLLLTFKTANYGGQGCFLMITLRRAEVTELLGARANACMVGFDCMSSCNKASGAKTLPPKAAGTAPKAS